jgi:exodeoxyribonuclease VII small subunit
MSAEWTFEKAITRLEHIVSKLEGGRCTLDESLKLFEEGTKLTAFCSKALKNAEQKITRLVSDNKDNSKTDKVENKEDEQQLS